MSFRDAEERRLEPPEYEDDNVCPECRQFYWFCQGHPKAASDHEPPKPFPVAHYTAVAVPVDFAKVVVEAAQKNKVLFEDQLLAWAQDGANCARMHKGK